MHYDTLSQLIKSNRHIRQYFLSQPVWLQIELHLYNDCIHCEEQLYYSVDFLIKQRTTDNPTE